MIRDWFRSKRALINDLGVQRGIGVFDRKQIEELQAENDQVWKDGLAEVQRVQRQRDEIRRNLGGQIRNQAATIAAQSRQLTALREELTLLLADIRREEQADRSVGIMRPLAARVLDRPMPWQTADAIEQETAAKRLADGEGDL